ncbi:MAG: hypothetical protein U9M95_02635 [Candidatus Altiarchaeota archaeon]|nr:hypothetical protein [Candidatus Altiarchaeota archaeon]
MKKTQITLILLTWMLILCAGCIDGGEKQPETETTIISITSTSITTTSTVKSTATTTIPGYMPEKTEISHTKIRLGGDLRSDVDAIYTPGKSYALIPVTKSGKSYLDIVGIYTNKITNAYIETEIPPPKAREYEFMSNRECETSFDCRTKEYPMCFEHRCVKVTDQLKRYIHNNYEHENCENKKCKRCEAGHLVSSEISYHNYVIEYCIECAEHIWKCKQGCWCINNKCVETRNLRETRNTEAIHLGGDLERGLDPETTTDGKIALLPIKTDAGEPGILRIIDLQTIQIKNNYRPAGKLEHDVDIIKSRDDKRILVPSRIEGLSRGFLDQLRLPEGIHVKRYKLKSDLRKGVDGLIISSGETAFMPSTDGRESSVDMIDLENKEISRIYSIPGILQYDVDPVLVEGKTLVLQPSMKGKQGYLNIINYSSKKKGYGVELSGILQESIDVRVSAHEGIAYMPSYRDEQGYVDLINLSTGEIIYTAVLEGGLKEGVDLLLTSNREAALIPSHAINKSYLNIINKGLSWTNLNVSLSGNLVEGVDLALSVDGETALVPSHRDGNTYIDMITVSTGELKSTVKLKGGLVKDVDICVVEGVSTAVMPSRTGLWELSGPKGYLTVIRNIPSGATLIPVTVEKIGCLEEVGYIYVLDPASSGVLKKIGLGGEIQVGVDPVASNPANSTPHPDEDLV